MTPTERDYDSYDGREGCLIVMVLVAGLAVAIVIGEIVRIIFF